MSFILIIGWNRASFLFRNSITKIIADINLIVLGSKTTFKVCVERGLKMILGKTCA